MKLFRLFFLLFIIALPCALWLGSLIMLHKEIDAVDRDPASSSSPRSPGSISLRSMIRKGRRNHEQRRRLIPRPRSTTTTVSGTRIGMDPDEDPLHEEDSSDDKSSTSNSFCKLHELPKLIERVFLMDAVYVPRENLLALIALAPRFFDPRKIELGYRKQAINHTFAYEDLMDPAIAFPIANMGGVFMGKCESVPTISRDINLNGRLFITVCRFPEPATAQQHEVMMKSKIFYLPSTKIGCVSVKVSLGSNSAGLLKDVKRFSDLGVSRKRSISVAIGGLRDYSPHFKELMQYYQYINVSHVYLGFNIDSDETWNRVTKELGDDSLLGPFIQRRFVSLTREATRDVTFTLGKIPFFNACLFHAKQHDDFLGIWDLDEMPVPHHPSRHDLVDTLYSIHPNAHDLCYLQLGSDILAKEEQPKDRVTYIEKGGRVRVPLLADTYRLRASGGVKCGNYSKSIAVTANTYYVGLHVHTACTAFGGRDYGKSKPESDAFLKVDKDKLSIFHYPNFWKLRQPETCADHHIKSEYSLYIRPRVEKMLQSHRRHHTTLA